MSTTTRKKFMSWDAELIEIIQETPDVRTFKFNKPKDFSFIPGQFVFVMFPDQFGKKKRAYSIASSPTNEDYLELTIKLYGLFTHHMFSLDVGSVWNLKGPFGKFTLDIESKSDVLLLGAGVGITPLMSMIRWAVSTKSERNFLLMYSNKTPSDIIYHKELQMLERMFPQLRVIYTLTRLKDKLKQTWPGLTGRINADMIREEVKKWQEAIGHNDTHPESYACGPIPMLETQEKVLLELGWPKESIHYEKFW